MVRITPRSTPIPPAQDNLSPHALTVAATLALPVTGTIEAVLDWSEDPIAAETRDRPLRGLAWDIVEPILQDGFRAIAVRDGLEALAALDRQPGDVIVADIAMPRLRGDARPVILMSAAMPAIPVPGASAMLSKSFDLDQLLAEVTRAVAPRLDGHARQ